MKAKYKVIEERSHQIVCDNPECDVVVDNVSKDQMINFVDVPCGKCGEPLLTKEDYRATKKLFRIVDILNHLFYPFMLLKGGKKAQDKGNVVGVNPRAGKTIVTYNDEE